MKYHGRPNRSRTRCARAQGSGHTACVSLAPGRLRSLVVLALVLAACRNDVLRPEQGPTQALPSAQTPPAPDDADTTTELERGAGEVVPALSPAELERLAASLSRERPCPTGTTRREGAPARISDPSWELVSHAAQVAHAGRRVGTWRTWHEDGSLESAGPYRAGQRHGHFRTWRKTGSLEREGEFVEDREHGQWTSYRKDGSVSEIERFDHGRLLERTRP